jgi:Transposase
VLAYFDRPGTSNGPTEAINGRLEHLRGSALGFRNPHQLHRQITARDRRIQTPATPWIMKSPKRSGDWPTASETLIIIDCGSCSPPTDAGHTEPDQTMLNSEDPAKRIKNCPGWCGSFWLASPLYWDRLA